MKLSSDFECGNGEKFEQTGPMSWRLQVRADRPGYDHYFHVRLEVEQERGTAQIEVLPDPGVRKPGRGDEDWTRERVGVLWRRRASDGPWERIPAAAFDAAAERLLIRQPVEPGETWFLAEVCALPYTDLQRHIEGLPALCDCAKPLAMGETPEGRPLPAARVTDPEVPAAEKGRVFILAGQHGTEFAGMYAAKGALDFLVSRLPQAAALRRCYIFDILICANPDGNAHGLACFNSESRDQLPAFAGAARGSEPNTTEAALIWRYLAANVPDLILNFHAYAHPRPFGDPPYEGLYVPDPKRLKSAEQSYHQQVLNHALFYLTPGGSQHRRLCPAHVDTLEDNAAALWNTLAALYQVQAAGGPHANLLTGVNVLRAAVESLELAHLEHRGL